VWSVGPQNSDWTFGVTGYGSYRCSVSVFPVSVCDCRRSCMVVLCVRKTCAVRLTLADRRCCYYCASVCLIIMSNTFTVEKKSETKSNPQHSPTVRVQAELFEPTDNRYPVFNYQKLLIEEVSATKSRLCMSAMHAHILHTHISYTHTRTNIRVSPA